MARTITILCDRHLGRDERVEGREVPVWGGRILALCEECEVELYKPLADVVEEFGIREDGVPPRRRRSSSTTVATVPTTTLVASKTTACLVCGEPVSTSHKSALTDHLKRLHRTSVNEVYGLTCPVCGTDDVTVGPHAARSHLDLGIHGAADAFDWARANGDPFGVVAARTAAAS